MDFRIAYGRSDGGVSFVVPSHGCTVEQAIGSVPSDAVGVAVIDAVMLPTDRLFRNGWSFDPVSGCKEDHTKCLAIAHEKRRAKRSEEFSPYDEIIAKQIPGKSAQDAETARSLIRSKYDSVQSAMDAATNPSELKSILAGL